MEYIFSRNFFVCIFHISVGVTMSILKCLNLLNLNRLWTGTIWHNLHVCLE